MASILINWNTGQVTAPGGTVIDHVDVDLLNGDTSVAQSKPGAPASGLPSSTQFDNVPAGNGYLGRARNFDQHGAQVGPDVLTNPVDVAIPPAPVTVISGGTASVIP
jgi:hypothetical protein